MNKKLFPYLLFFLAPTFVVAQGIEFFHGTWAEALEKAKAEGKLIFVDAYASWCGPCKRMASQIFPDQEVGQYFNSTFVNMKIDMEKPENEEFARKYPVGSFPTLMFIDGAGKVVHKEIGARDVKGLIELGKKALSRDNKSADYEKLYNEGNRDPEFLLNFVAELNKANKPSLKITNEYLKTQKDLSTTLNSKFLLEGAVEADSRVFDLLLKNRQTVISHTSEEAFNRRVELACRNTVKKAIEFRNEELLGEAKTKMKQGLPDKAERFGYEVDMQYFAAIKDAKKFLSAAKGYQKSEIKDNPARLHDLVIAVIRAFPNDSDIVKQSEKWAKSAAEDGQKPEFYMTYAEILKRRGNKDKAREAALKAKELIGQSDENFVLKIDYFINDLN